MTLLDIIDPSWEQVLAPIGDVLEEIDEFLDGEVAAGREFMPVRKNVMRPFTIPFEKVKVLIVGQDPYPHPDYPIGLAFAVNRSITKLPMSLRNIYTELEADLGITPPRHGDLSSWCKQGVMLLNRVLTVEPRRSNSHAGIGWEKVTECAIRALAHRGGPLVAILWGNPAQKLAPLLGDVPVICSAHPSPLSARRGFFGSRPFSRANQLLIEQGADPVDWRLA